MKTVLYWFSGTGNTLAVARDLAAKIGDTELIPIAKALAMTTLPEAQRVGIVFPVYAFGPPRIVREFARKAPLAKGAYLFSVATMGGTAGATHTILRNDLRGRGLVLSAGWSVAMPSNCISLAPAPKEPKQKKFFARASAKVDAIALVIKDGRGGVLQDSIAPVRWIAVPLSGIALKHFPEGDKKFSVTDKCIHCGACARVCPVANIRMNAGTPEWLHHCEQCYACINWCPTAAIEAGRMTPGRKRYHHPGVDIKDLSLR